MAQTDSDRRKGINTILVVLVGQVGCLTLALVLGSIWGGLWLDRTFGTKPVFTLLLLLAGIPLSVVLMLFIARRTIARINSERESKDSA